ncbi:TonB-dependent receptor [Elongatibacter sediminis]|uniref:TonB-dependent receptor n=1 Tax=Elongatibacter sediminis TaxID=3119006 RepID=A0AAW9RIX4_9GAMM
MKSGKVQREFSLAAFAATAFACLLCGMTPAFLLAAEESVLPGSDSHRLVHQQDGKTLHDGAMHPGTPMILDPDFGGIPFSSSTSSKLQLRLAQPLILQTSSELNASQDTGLLGLDATLQVPLTDGLSLSSGIRQALGQGNFQALGSIHCANGTLRPDSYTASGCRFINDARSQFDSRTLSLGSQLDIGNVSTSLNWFTSQAEYRPGLATALTPGAAPLLDPGLAAFEAGTSMLPGAVRPSALSAETSGIDLDFQVGFTTDQAGEIRLGLALTRIYGASYDGLYSNSGSPLQWNIAAPFNTASMGIEWSRGAFSGGLRAYYREPVSFLDRNTLDSMGTFDVHFTWRTPWNANLSVGASNVLNAGVENRTPTDDASDRFESIYGRIPYVRYQQDL